MRKRTTARAVAGALDASMVRRLLEAVPAALRSLLEPEKLLDVLGVSLTSTPDELAEGVDLLVEHTSGNFRIDEPFLDALYRVFEARTATGAAGLLGVAGRSRFPIEGYLMRFPEAAVAMLASDLDLTADLAAKSDSVTFPPARFLYRVMHADPNLAAGIVDRLDRRGEDELVTEALVHFAYDCQRLAAVPGLPIAVENIGHFLSALINENSTDWLEARLRQAVGKYSQLVAHGELPADFLTAYRTTLEAAAESRDDAPSRAALNRIVDNVFAAVVTPKCLTPSPPEGEGWACAELVEVMRGSLSQRTQVDLPCRHPLQRFDQKLVLAFEDPGAQRLHGIAAEHRHFALGHDRPVVVLGVDDVDRYSRDRLSGYQHSLVHAPAVHALTAELGEQRRVYVQDSAHVLG